MRVNLNPEHWLPDATRSLEESNEVTLLALMIWGEARGEITKGKHAVAHVAMNRLYADSWYGHTLRDVLLKPYQFSCFNDRGGNNPVWGIRSDNIWHRCLLIALQVLDGRSSDPTNGATHYHAKSIVPGWVSSMVHTVDIQNHKFYCTPLEHAKWRSHSMEEES